MCEDLMRRQKNFDVDIYLIDTNIKNFGQGFLHILELKLIKTYQTRAGDCLLDVVVYELLFFSGVGVNDEAYNFTCLKDLKAWTTKILKENLLKLY